MTNLVNMKGKTKEQERNAKQNKVKGLYDSWRLAQPRFARLNTNCSKVPNWLFSQVINVSLAEQVCVLSSRINHNVWWMGFYR